MSKRFKQLTLNDKHFGKATDCFGGSLLKGNPKNRRPLDSKLPIHLVLRARSGHMRIPRLFRPVNQLVEDCSRKHGVTIYRYANVGNHLHLLLKISRRHRWPPFIRELTGRIAYLVQFGDSKGIDFRGGKSLPQKAQKYKNPHAAKAARAPHPYKPAATTPESFWLFRPYTRIVRDWRRAFLTAKKYIHLNVLEAEGFISRLEIKTLKDLRAIWSG